MLAEPRFSVERELVTGPDRYEYNFVSYSLNSSYLTPTDGWNFTVTDPNDPAALRRTWRPLQPVKLYIDNQLQVQGRIDRIEGTGPGGAQLQVHGRDYLADLVDGGADPAVRFTKEQDLGAAILSVTKAFGIVTIGSGGFNLTRNLLTGKKPYNGEPQKDFRASKLEDFKIEQNQGAFEVINKIAARYGLTIQPSAARDTICLSEPEYRQEPLYTFTRPGNIMDATAVRDYSSVPTITIATCRVAGSKKSYASVIPSAETYSRQYKVPIDVAEAETAKSAAATSSTTPLVLNFAVSDLSQNAEVKRIIEGVIEDVRFNPKKEGVAGNGGKLYRPLYYNDEDSRKRAHVVRGVQRVVSEKLRDTLQYECSIRGHSDPDTGAVYAVDTIAHVSDGTEDLDENLWVMERTFENTGSGPVTHLKMIRPGSYLI